MLIKKATLSANKHDEIVEHLQVLFGDGNHSNVIRGIASAACISAVQYNDDAIESGEIPKELIGAVTAISPMEIGTTIDVLMHVAYNAGLKAKD
jgi:hypothetical protein